VPKQVFEVSFQPANAEQADSSVEIDKEVVVAVLMSTSNRTDKRD